MPPSSTPSTPPRRHLKLAAAFLGLLIAGLALFWPAVHGPFVFDDFPNLQNLEHVDGTLDLPHIGEYLASFNGNPGRPLAALSFLIEDSAWPTSPLAFKRDNLLLHLLAGVLVFALTRKLARQLATTRASADVIALATMAMWVLHPMQLSATMLVVQRMNILASICMLLGLIGYVGCVTRSAWPDARRVLSAGAILALSATLGLLCKENGVLVFAYAVALNLTVLREAIAEVRPPWRRLLLAGTALPVAALAVAALVKLPEIQAGYRGRDFTLGERLLTEPRILFDYVREILLPRIGDQGLFHDGYVASSGLMSPPSTLLSLAALAVLTTAAWLLRARRPLFALAVLWFLAGHLLESTVIPLELYFEHRNYLPMVGMLFACAAGVSLTTPEYRRLAWALLAVWILMVSALTYVNARTWGDRGTLATVWLQENPQSIRAVQMVAAYRYEIGDLAGTHQVLREGHARIPKSDELLMQETLLDCYSTGLTRPAWDRLLALAARSEYSAIMPELASDFGEQQRGERCHGTLRDGDFSRLAEALIHNPNASWRGDAMGYIYYEMFRQAAYDGNLQKTMEYGDAAYAARPDPLVARNQAIYLLTAGLPDDAMRYLRKSENTPQPWFKRHVFDVVALNAPLWKNAKDMKAYLERHPLPARRPAQAVNKSS